MNSDNESSMHPALKALGAAGILGVGVLGAGLLVAFQETDTPKDVVPLVPVVSAVELMRDGAPAQVLATGQVQAGQQVVVMPQVSGRVLTVAGNLDPGGRFSKGALLAQIDGSDYRNSVAQAQAQVRGAELDLALERGRGESAAREWALIGGEGDQALALRVPHLASAEARLSSAQAGLSLAQRQLSRTRLSAPFNAVVLTESLDPGQVVGPSTQAVVLAGTDSFRVEVSVPVDKLVLLDVPGLTGQGGLVEAGSMAQVSGAGGVQRQGRVVGMASQLDPQTRTATLLVDISSPLDPPAGQLPLLLGSFVDVSLEGRQVEDVIGVPRQALVDGQTVLVVHGDDTLGVVPVQVEWSTVDMVFVTGDFGSGDRAITSTLNYPLQGMALRVQE